MIFDDVVELDALPANWGKKSQNDDLMIWVVKDLWREVLYHRSTLLYCKKGFNRSAWAAVLLLSYITGLHPQVCYDHVALLRPIWIDEAGWEGLRRIWEKLDEWLSWPLPRVVSHAEWEQLCWDRLDSVPQVCLVVGWVGDPS